MVASSSTERTFAAAERAYLAGRLGEARALLDGIIDVGLPAAWHLSAIVEQDLGNFSIARQRFETALTTASNNHRLWNDYGALLYRLGDTCLALEAFEHAIALAPQFSDAKFNRALLLNRLGRHEEARGAFRDLTAKHPADARYWNGLAAVERAGGDLAAAAVAFDRALATAPSDPLATVGRARVALERQEPDALRRYRRARQVAPDNLELALDEIEERLDRGDLTALADLASLTRNSPDWTGGQIALARMQWERGEKVAFAKHIDLLLERDPRRGELWRSYVQLLADCGEYARAADTAQAARRALPDAASLCLAEAINAGKAGQIERAESLFDELAPGVPGRDLHASVHRIRRGELDRATRLVEAALAADRWSFAAWGIAELLYRKTGHRLGEWLSGQPGLVTIVELPLASEEFLAVDALLLRLHESAVETVGQSVRGGTQTRWQLFDRTEPELALLRAAIERAVAAHVEGMPSLDGTHPLLRHREGRRKFSASWSVRFLGSGHHVPHYHPKGLISSACYFRVPPHGGGPHEGWLEIGRPPPDFKLDLEPIETIEPKPGRLVLFPSYLFHGTRPFSGGERMSVAFDIAAAEGNV